MQLWWLDRLDDESDGTDKGFSHFWVTRNKTFFDQNGWKNKRAILGDVLIDLNIAIELFDVGIDSIEQLGIRSKAAHPNTQALVDDFSIITFGILLGHEFSQNAQQFNLEAVQP